MGAAAVPDWKYALLLARSFEAVPWPADSGVHDHYYALSLAHRLAEIARLRAGGGRLNRSEADFVAELADAVVGDHAPQTDATVITWFIEALPRYVEGLRTALTEPRRAVDDLISGMGPAGQFWPTRQVWWLQMLLVMMECLHPTRPVGPGRYARVAEGMAAIARLAGIAHPNLVAFARTGMLRDEAHRAAVQTELAGLAASVDSDAEVRPLTRLLDIKPSAPVGVCFHA